MIHPTTIAAFADELEKIAAMGSEQLGLQSSGSEQLVTTSLTDPLNSWAKNPDMKQNAPQNQKGPKKPAKVPDASAPAQNANRILFREPAVPGGDAKTTKFKTLANDSSEAKQMNRDGSPIDAQSTANVASANMIAPASGPGGV